MKNFRLQLIHLLQEKLGDKLRADYEYGRFASFVNSQLLAVINDDVDPAYLRQCFLPFWERQKMEWETPPLLVSHTAIAKHMQLDPLWARRVAEGTCLYGDKGLRPPNEPDLQEQIAHAAWKSMLASALIAPQLLDDESEEETTDAFEDAARWASEAETELSTAQLAAVQRKLQAQLQRLNIPVGQLSPPDDPLLPGLLAVYKLLDKMVLVFDDSLPERLVDIDWNNVADMVKGETKGLYAVTAVQLRLILTYETPVAFVLRNYKHDWGIDLLADFAVLPPFLFRAAARKSSNIRINTFPRAYFMQGDEYLHDIIHDFQNKLLNIQLEHELLYRLQGIEKFNPSQPLPDREAPPDVRIRAIFQQLDEWTAYYAALMIR